MKKLLVFALAGALALPAFGGSSVTLPNAKQYTDAVRADLASTASGKGAALIGVKASGAGAVDRTVKEKFADSVSAADYGAKCDGATNDTAAFAAALAAHKSVRIPVGDCRITGGLVISLDGAKFRGEGTTASKLTVTTASTAAITVNAGLNNVEISGFTLTRNVSATSGGDGIKTSGGSIGQSLIERLVIEKHWNGLNLGPTDWSSVRDVIVTKNNNDGVVISNTAGDGAVQWSFDTVLAQMNGARGFLIQSVAGPAGMTLGTFKNIATFANSGFGFAVVGSAGVPINGVRIFGGFIGEDGNSEIYLDTYGGQHVISDVFLELAGRRTTGPTLATGASNIGNGIEVTGNNTDVQLTGVHSNGNSMDGFYLNGTNHMLGNCRATNNGLALTAGRRNGVNSGSGRIVINGGALGNTGAGVSQQYGAFVANGNNLAVIGSDLTNNATAPTGATAQSTYITQIGNLPNTTNVQLSAQGAVMVGGGATGGFVAGGTINVSSGLLKNNTAYTNP